MRLPAAIVYLMVVTSALPALVAPTAAPPASVDMVDFVLGREAAWEPGGDHARARATFDRLVERCRVAVAAAAGPQEAIAALNRVLLEDHCIGYRSSDYWHDVRLSTVLLERQGNCWGLSLLYVTIGARLGLPLRVVREPGHALVRWDDGSTVIDLEITDLGTAVPTRRDGPLRVLVEPGDLRAELLRLELQRWLVLGAGDRAATTLAALAAESVAPDERLLWQARVEALGSGAREMLVTAAQQVVANASAPFGLRAEAHRILADHHLAAGRLAAADAALAAASPLVGRTHRAHLAVRRARIALRRGQSLMAEELARTACALDPTALEPVVALAEALIACDRPDGALAALAAARVRHPDEHAVVVAEAACLHRSGQRSAALERIDALSAAAAGDARLAFNLAWFHAHSGDAAAVRMWLVRARTLADEAAVAQWMATAAGPAALAAVWSELVGD